MKRTAIISAILALTMAMTACGSSDSSLGGANSKPAETAKAVGSSKSADTEVPTETEQAKSEQSETEESAETETPPEGTTSGGILVAYFTPAENGENDAVTSASKVSFWGEDMGNAEAMANVVAAYVGGDLFSIQTVKDYPLEYNDLADNAKAEQDAGELPELATAVDISGYDTVFLVYPIWWYTMPQPIYSFLDEYDLSGKTVIPVTTHEGSGLADSISKISELEPNAEVKEGYSVRGGDVGGSQNDIESWLKELGY
ncbi:MAG: flavodoxin [Ruminococcus sp.]|nr:flavodoxin [Ruminococcus sp.]